MTVCGRTWVCPDGGAAAGDLPGQSLGRGMEIRNFYPKLGELGHIPGGWNGLSQVPSRDPPSHGGGSLGFGRQAQLRSRHQTFGGKLHQVWQNQ